MKDCKFCSFMEVEDIGIPRAAAISLHLYREYGLKCLVDKDFLSIPIISSGCARMMSLVQQGFGGESCSNVDLTRIDQAMEAYLTDPSMLQPLNFVDFRDLVKRTDEQKVVLQASHYVILANSCPCTPLIGEMVRSLNMTYFIRKLRGRL